MKLGGEGKTRRAREGDGMDRWEGKRVVNGTTEERGKGRGKGGGGEKKKKRKKRMVTAKLR
jgi:hypothetical protein